MHSVQFFDASDTLGTAVAQFLCEGIERGGIALAVARPSSIQAIARALSARGVSLSALIENGSLTIVDAGATLESFMDGLVPDPGRFRAVIGRLVRQLRDRTDGDLRVYGEMVDILATEGNFSGVEALEDLWNELLEAEPLTLMCGYWAAHFTAPGTAEAMRAICSKHDHVSRHNADVLANWLLTKSADTPV